MCLLIKKLMGPELLAQVSGLCRDGTKISWTVYVITSLSSKRLVPRHW